MRTLTHSRQIHRCIHMYAEEILQTLSFTLTHKHIHQYSWPLNNTSTHPFLRGNHAVKGLSITPNHLPKYLFPTFGGFSIARHDGLCSFHFLAFFSLCSPLYGDHGYGQWESAKALIDTDTICKRVRSHARVSVSLYDLHSHLTE